MTFKEHFLSYPNDVYHLEFYGGNKLSGLIEVVDDLQFNLKQITNLELFKTSNYTEGFKLYNLSYDYIKKATKSALGLEQFG